jgi:hypothetical protein
MSFTAMQAVLDYSQTTGPARAIMLILAYRANEQWECWPGIDGLSKNAGLSRSTTIRQINTIRKAGELFIIRGGHALGTPGGKQVSNRYKITLKGGSTLTPPSTKGGSRLTQGGVTEDHKGVARRHKGGSTLTPELKGNRNKETNNNQNARGGDSFLFRSL